MTNVYICIMDWIYKLRYSVRTHIHIHDASLLSLLVQFLDQYEMTMWSIVQVAPKTCPWDETRRRKEIHFLTPPPSLSHAKWTKYDAYMSHIWFSLSDEGRNCCNVSGNWSLIAIQTQTYKILQCIPHSFHFLNS